MKVGPRFLLWFALPVALVGCGLNGLSLAGPEGEKAHAPAVQLPGKGTAQTLSAACVPMTRDFKSSKRIVASRR